MSNYGSTGNNAVSELKTIIDSVAKLQKHIDKLERELSDITYDYYVMEDKLAEVRASTGGGFDETELKRLISLCHPDKHDGKQSAVEMTQKLIAMRKNL